MPDAQRGAARTQRPLTRRMPAAQRAAARRVGVRTQTPRTRCMPAPQAWRTCVMRLSVCGAGAIGTACADDAHAKARTKATAVNRIMETLLGGGWLRTDLSPGSNYRSPRVFRVADRINGRPRRLPPLRVG